MKFYRLCYLQEIIVNKNASTLNEIDGGVSDQTAKKLVDAGYKEVVLTGAQRMKERPIKVLVDVLKQMGAEISYEENDGYPPLKISGKKKLKLNLVAGT